MNNWEKEFDKKFNWEEIFGKDSKAQQAVKQFIKDLRKKDEEELTKMFNDSGMGMAMDKIEDYYKESYDV
jgi:SMC interacting uncharacterized protein involved in chromosome segregation